MGHRPQPLSNTHPNNINGPCDTRSNKRDPGPTFYPRWPTILARPAWAQTSRHRTAATTAIRKNAVPPWESKRWHTNYERTHRTAQRMCSKGNRCNGHASRPAGTRHSSRSRRQRDPGYRAALNGLLADVFAFYLKTKNFHWRNFHWHMSGPHFRD